MRGNKRTAIAMAMFMALPGVTQAFAEDVSVPEEINIEYDTEENIDFESDGIYSENPETESELAPVTSDESDIEENVLDDELIIDEDTEDLADGIESSQSDELVEAPAWEDTETEMEAETDAIEEIFSSDRENELMAAKPQLNTEEVTLYGIGSDYSSFLSLPSGYANTFQLEVTGTDATPSYIVSSGTCVKVDSTGLITVDENSVDTDATVTVNVDGYEYNVSVHVIDYPTIYVNDVLKNWMNNNLTSSMSQLDKLKAITKYAAENYNYSASYASINGMVLSGGGNCYASSRMIVYMCQQQGITAGVRDGRSDTGAAEQHQNVLASVDGKYYVAEAGYTGQKPRQWDVYEKSSLFNTSSNTDGSVTITGWDGNDTNLVIPESINGAAVTAIGKEAFWGRSITSVTLPETLERIGDRAFYVCRSLTSVTIPASVTTVGSAAFGECEALSEISVETGSSTYKSIDGILFSADGTVLVEFPSGKQDQCYDIPSGVTKIGSGAFDGGLVNLTSITIPEGVVEIGENSFSGLRLKSLTIPASVKVISVNAFAYFFNPITVLSKDAQIGEGAFYVGKIYKKGQYITDSITLTGYSGSTTETYANEHGITFKVIDEAGGEEHNHTWGAWVETPATCVNAGKKTRTCTECGETESQNISATGHKAGETKMITESTCTKEGKRGTYCSVCGELISTEAVKAKGHSAGGTKMITEPTCTKEGKRGTYCSVCGELISTAAVKAKGHSAGEWKVVKEPTCTEKGTRSTYCNVCGELIKSESIPVKRHTEGAARTSKAATCTQNGERQILCSVCGQVIRLESIPATGHKNTAEKTVIQADCLTNGFVQTYCTTCGAVLSSRTVPAKGHTPGAVKVTTEPTCTSTGVKTTYCAVCGKDIGVEVIAAKGHVWSEWKVTQASTCTSDGKYTRECASCHKTETQTIPATGHSFGEWKTVVEPTVFEGGRQQRTCSACGRTETKMLNELSPFINTNVSSVSIAKGSKATINVSLQKGDSVSGWRSSNKKIATVSSKGVVTGKKKGTAVITIKTGAGVSKSVKVTVTDKKKASSKTKKLTVSASGLKKNKITIKKGKSVTLKAKKTPSNSSQKITYSSSNKKIAAVNSKGKITAKKKGKCTITVKSGSKKVKISVTVK